MSPGTPKDISVSRGESTSIHATIVVINTLCRVHGVQQGSITIGCDWELALLTMFGDKDCLRVDNPSFDLLAAIHKMREKTRITWHTKHVEGYQDTMENLSQLDRWSLLNIEADGTAKRKLCQAPSLQRIYVVQDEPWSLWMGEQKIQKVREEVYH